MDEVVRAGGQDNVADRVFVAASDHVELGERVLARTRPFSLVAIEDRQGKVVFGYPVGLRPPPLEQAQGDQRLPESFRSLIVRFEPDQAGALTLLDANDDLLSIPLVEITRLYYPNRLDLVDRARLLLQRLRECWEQSCPHPPFDQNAAFGHEAVIESG